MSERTFLDQSPMDLRLNSYNTAEKTKMIFRKYGISRKKGFCNYFVGINTVFVELVFDRLCK
jgi:hypothetical protein